MSENAWILTAGLAVLSILVTISVAIIRDKRDRKSKFIDFQWVSDVYLLQPETKSVADLRVYVGELKLENPRLVTLTFRNSGNVEIKADEYIVPITVGLGSGRGPVDAAIISQKPPDVLDASRIVLQEDAAIITPKVFNKRESFTIQFLFDDDDSKLRVECRFPAQTHPIRFADVVQAKRANRSFNISGVIGLVTLAVSLAIFLIDSVAVGAAVAQAMILGTAAFGVVSILSLIITLLMD
jgi:hypothetical protein